MKRALFLMILGLIVLIASFFWYERTHAPVVVKEQIIVLSAPDGAETEVKVELADDDTERMKGLMFRENLEPGTGMFFEFDREQPLSFWMKNTLIPLDIAFFDDEGVFVSRSTMQPCVADPCTGYPAAGPAKYALEVAAGEPLTQEVGEGWKVSVE